MEKRGHFGNINMMETRTLNMIGDEELQGGGGVERTIRYRQSEKYTP